jgi:hypothetical protein
VGGLVGELFLPIQSVSEGVHQPVDLPTSGVRLGLDGEIEGLRLAG